MITPDEHAAVRFSGNPFGTRLLGDEHQEPRRLRLRVQIALTLSLLTTNAIGVGVVVALCVFAIPGPDVRHGWVAGVTFGVLPAYLVVAFVGSLIGVTRRVRGQLDWVLEDRAPTAEEAAATFDVPRTIAVLQAIPWTVGDLLFTILYASASGRNLTRTFFPVAFGGIVVAAFSYVLAEINTRPIAARALATHLPRRKATVRERTLLAWATGSAIPVVGIVLVAAFALVQGGVSVGQVCVTVIAIAVTMLVFGLGLMLFLTATTVSPIRGVRAAMAEVAEGRFDVEVAVYDGTELGELQTGFNRMAAGLRERDRVERLFGQHVGAAIAREALAEEATLGGREESVAVLFVDVVGSTTYAESHAPGDVVELLNRFFGVVVDEVDRHGGVVDKFIGDAALALFGAPSRLDSPATSCLAAERAIVARLSAEMPELQVGAGASFGTVVVGNVGARDRLEYTAIGDPVNEAARLSDLAKDEGALLASGTAVLAATEEEQGHWRHRGAERLRGRSAATEVYVPA